MHINPHEITILGLSIWHHHDLVKSPGFFEEICPDCGPCRAMWSRATAAWQIWQLLCLFTGHPMDARSHPKKMWYLWWFRGVSWGFNGIYRDLSFDLWGFDEIYRDIFFWFIGSGFNWSSREVYWTFGRTIGIEPTKIVTQLWLSSGWAGREQLEQWSFPTVAVS